ncbi:styrene monooxygenase/indole monooxygenase family protein [Mycolicibacterium sp. XJ2546]
MRKITIVGAGQSGLQLGIGLVDNGYDVTIVSNRAPSDIASGRVLSSQCMLGTALARERRLGLNLWDEECPAIDGISMNVAGEPGEGRAVSWSSRLDLPGQSVDQRVKIPAWMSIFESRGGKLVYEEAGTKELEVYTKQADLVIVAAGKGEVAKLFPRDTTRSTYDTPQRALALTYVTGMAPRDGFSAVEYHIIPGAGEYFTFPALTTTGPCDIIVMEGIPRGPMDCWSDITSPQMHLERTLQVVKTHVPWEAERCTDVELTDDNGILAGRFPPTVRKPVATLPSGAHVLGMADVVVLNDPLTGQGSSNASRCATTYLNAILDHGEASFDTQFMIDTFERYWNYARYATGFTNLLLAPPREHVLRVLAAGHDDRRIPYRFCNGLDDLRDFYLWFMDPDVANAFVDEASTP